MRHIADLLPEERRGYYSDDPAQRAAAEEALKTRAGARGLRTILERTLLDVMYEIPTRDDVEKLITVGARAVLIGQTLCEQPSIEQKYAELFD